MDRVRNNDAEAVAEVFAHYRDRLKRMVRLRLDRRLQGRVDPSDVLQEAWIDVNDRAAEYANKPEMPFFLWMRMITGQRLLDRKTKELLQIVVEAALRADVEQIQAHVRVALQEGATPQEILEALQAVIAPMGALAFRRGLQAWAAETGFEAV